MKNVLPVCVAAALFAASPQPQTGAPIIAPTDNLVVEGVPPIPAALAEEVRRYTEFRTASFADWHPARREMLIGTRFGNTAQVHLVKMPGGARTQLTFFPDRASGGQFQPETGDSFVFLKDVGGNEFFQLYRYAVATGDVTLLTDGKSRNVSPRWSRDGRHLVYSSTRRNGSDFDLYMLDPTDPKSDRRVMELQGAWAAADFSPDDSRLLLVELVSVNESHLWLADLARGTKEPLTPRGGAVKVAYSAAQFSKDGKGFYTSTDKDSEFQRLAHVDLTTRRYTYLTDHIKWDVDGFDLSPDGRTIAFTTNEDGVSRLHLLDVKSGKERPAPSLPTGVVNGLRWHQNSRDVGFTLNTARAPLDVYSINVPTGKVERWTESETGGINTAQLPEPRLIRWPSFDGRTMSGFVYMPPARFTGPRPVVVSIHGGPEGQSRPVFLARQNYFLNEMGIAFVYPNVRGSTGYGKAFVALDNGMKREDTYKDIGTLLDWIKTQPELDASRVMVTGGSYGGHMSFAVATRYSDRIKATLPVVGISNLVSFLERTESYRRDLRRVEYGDERDPQMREFMTRTAPLNNAKNITKPMFVVAGGNDPRVPLNEAEQMVATVRKNGTPVWYLMAKDEGHGFAKKANVDFQFYATVAFVREYLVK
jgi:dipeptidyl aminopeptidase/acylaminoacyl peptidase